MVRLSYRSVCSLSRADHSACQPLEGIVLRCAAQVSCRIILWEVFLDDLVDFRTGYEALVKMLANIAKLAEVDLAVGSVAGHIGIGSSRAVSDKHQPMHPAYVGLSPPHHVGDLTVTWMGRRSS